MKIWNTVVADDSPKNERGKTFFYQLYREEEKKDVFFYELSIAAEK